jgi:quinol monooxygenase YgiN
MSGNIEWVLEMDIRKDSAGDVEALVTEMVSETRAKEPGALVYEYFTNADKTRCTVIERYADNEAVMAHLENFGAHFAQRFFAIFEPVRFSVYGPADDNVREALSQLGATFDDRLAGFSR